MPVSVSSGRSGRIKPRGETDPSRFTRKTDIKTRDDGGPQFEKFWASPKLCID